MNPGFLRGFIIILLVLNGLFFVSNIYVLGHPAEAIAMHQDLSRDASPLMAETKVIVTFVAGILYLLTAVGAVTHQRGLAVCGLGAFLLFDGLYVFELAAWGTNHPSVWISFAIFGGLATLFGIYSWLEWRRASPRSGVIWQPK